MDPDNPPQTVFEEYGFSAMAGTVKYVCSVCGCVYGPAGHDGEAFEALPRTGSVRGAGSPR